MTSGIGVRGTFEGVKKGAGMRGGEEEEEEEKKAVAPSLLKAGLAIYRGTVCWSRSSLIRDMLSLLRQDFRAAATAVRV